MRDTLMALCQKFLENKDAVRAVLKWESAYLYPVAAMTFTEAEKDVDAERILAAKALLKQEIPVFSSFSEFRGMSQLSLISKMAVSEDAKARLSLMMDAYMALKNRFSSSTYLPIAAMLLSDCDGMDYAAFTEMADRARACYDMMRKKHPFLTSSEDVIFSVLMALSGRDTEDLMEDVEACYGYLKEDFYGGDTLQSLSHALALIEGAPREKVEKLVLLYLDLKELKHSIGTGYELPTLASVVSLPHPKEEIVRDLVEIDGFLAEQKGYKGIFASHTRKERMMHACMILSAESRKGNAVSTSVAVLAGLLAQQAAMCAAVAASRSSS